jgi:hypothetical protein
VIEPGALKALDLAGRGYRVRHNTVPALAQASLPLSANIHLTMLNDSYARMHL